MYQHRRFRTTISKKWVPESYINNFLVREPVSKINRLHPEAKKIYNRMIQEPEPLKYKLMNLPQKDNSLNEPLGVKQAMPFKILRTHTGNLPVFSDFKNGRQQKLTILKNIYGDIDEVKGELSKICSNTRIEARNGRLEISGQHTQKVKLWLRRLGY